MALSRLALGSGVLLALCFLSWLIALGGLGAINWLVCSDYQKTLADIVANFDTNFNGTTASSEELAGQLAIKLNLPVNGTAASSDVALCSRSWRWEWFCLFFQFAIVASGLVVTVIPNRLARARFPLANLLSIATVIIMVALNENITDVWHFWDTHKMFNQWEGVLQKLYMSAAALVAGWVMVLIFNIIWIAFALDAEDEGKKDEAKKAEGAPMTV